jgi:hypothetical protein
MHDPKLCRNVTLKYMCHTLILLVHATSNINCQFVQQTQARVYGVTPHTVNNSQEIVFLK